MNVIIGKEYEKEFESIRTLVKNGFVDERIIKRIGNKTIETGSYVFEYSENVDAQKSRGNRQGNSYDGAPWFDGIRGGAGDDGIAKWINLIQQVATEYHKRYSVVEYMQKESQATKRDPDVINALKKIAQKFFPSLHAVVRNGDEKDGLEDIYGVSLRVEISGGTGESVPVLGKVFFRKVSGKLIPIEAEEAAEVDSYLSDVAPEVNERTGGRGGSATAIIDSVLKELDNLLYLRLEGYDLAKCIVWSGAEDVNTVDDISARIAHDNVRLECSSVRILGISHVKWVNACYIIEADGEPVLRAIVGLDGAITLTCLCCNGGILIANGRITCNVDSFGGTEKRSYLLNVKAANLGLDKQQEEEISKYSEFAKHLITLACPESKRIQGDASLSPKICSKRLCYANADNLGTDENPIYKCKDCPYPEVVFQDKSGVKRHTPALSFARDKMTLVPETETCSCCGRTFSPSYMKGDVCSFCHDAIGLSGDARQVAKNTYKKYADLFSLAKRLRYIGKEKLCVEQEDILLFLLGDDVYIFDKFDMTAHGYLNQPRKVQY